MDTARTISEARQNAGLTQQRLAELGGTSQATISAYESGRKQPSVATLSRLLAATGSRLTAEEAGFAVTQPSRPELERTARTLVDVLDLAAALPVEYEPTLRYPRLVT